jgi:hypothetical protein
MMMDRFQDEAKTLSAAATPELVKYLASAPFRAALTACCPVAAAMSAPELLQALRDEHSGAEMVHNFPVAGTSDPRYAIEDTNFEAEANASAFYNIWEYAFISGEESVLAATSFSETNMFGFKPFTGGNATDPGSQPKSFDEAQERPIYTALNTLVVDSGNPLFGPISAVFQPNFVRNMTFVAPMDTGYWEMFCNTTYPPADGGGFQSRFRLGMDPAVTPIDGVGGPPRNPINCSAWGGHTFGTLGHLDHLLLLSERLWLNHSTIQETFQRLFEPIPTAVPTLQTAAAKGLQTMHYLEADLAGNVIFPDGVKSVLAQARLLGTAAAAALRDWCVGNGWALLWSAGPYCLLPDNNIQCYVQANVSYAAVAAGQVRILDPAVAARLGAARIDTKLPPGAEEAFRAVEDSAFGTGSALNATDRNWPVMTPRVQAGWTALLQAVPAEARMRALRAADGCDLDRCVGAEAAAPVGSKAPHCACYVDA